MWASCAELDRGGAAVGDDGLPLDQWANFYLITSAAAATLVGLFFVVTLVAVVMLAFIGLGLRNSWSIAVQVVSSRPSKKDEGT